MRWHSIHPLFLEVVHELILLLLSQPWRIKGRKKSLGKKKTIRKIQRQENLAGAGSRVVMRRKRKRRKRTMTAKEARRKSVWTNPMITLGWMFYSLPWTRVLFEDERASCLIVTAWIINFRMRG